ncbi:hypothetical protein N7530_000103 [Penicillium desertorum]|uniref:Uncharacterized protein n=1 Tax=Penicillium desertorum TaxID=1303715 RepID=A0A9X0BV16_9EURO|nr:hypothetical protein N7530_000103 [Penicillium desertorum]
MSPPSTTRVLPGPFIAARHADRGANLHRTWCGETPLEVSINRNRCEIVKILIAPKAGTERLYQLGY